MKPVFVKAEFDEMLFKALRAIYRFERVKVSRFGLSYEGIYLLQYLRRHAKASMSQIAVEMNCPLSTVTRIVDRLQKKGFLSRVRDEKDLRVYRLSLEAEGEAVVKAIETHTYQVLMENLQLYDDQDFESFIKTALNMEKLLDISSIE